MGFNKKLHNHIFYENVTVTDEIESCIMPVDADESTLNLTFVTSGAFSAKVYGAIINKDNFYPVPVFKFPALDLIENTITDKNYMYTVDLTGFDYIKVVLVTTSDSISVYGKAVG